MTHTTESLMELADTYGCICVSYEKGNQDSTEGARDSLQSAITDLVAERDTLKSDIANLMRDERFNELEVERDALAKDAERLDWLEASTESHGFCHIQWGEYRYYAHQQSGYRTAREVIDAAMKETP